MHAPTEGGRMLLTRARTALALLLGLAGRALGQAGIPDDTFGTHGLVITELTPRHDGARAVAIQPDGRIVVVGSAGAPPHDANQFSCSSARRGSRCTESAFETRSSSRFREWLNPFVTTKSTAGSARR